MLFFISTGRTFVSEEVKNTVAWPCLKSYRSTTRTTIFTRKQDLKIAKEHTMQQKYIPNKQVPIYACPAAGNRCHVRVLDMYYSKLPEQAFENDVFYLKPSGFPKKSWFINVHQKVYKSSGLLHQLDTGVWNKYPVFEV